jgi:hypothetical protein
METYEASDVVIYRYPVGLQRVDDPRVRALADVAVENAGAVHRPLDEKGEEIGMARGQTFVRDQETHPAYLVGGVSFLQQVPEDGLGHRGPADVA